MRRTVAAIAVPVLLAVLATAAVAASESWPDGLRPPLADVLEVAPADARVPVSVVLREQVSAERLRLATAGLRGDDARRAAIATLRANAAGTQAPLLARLAVLERAGRVANVRPLWIGNVVGVDATPEVVREIAARPEVAWVNHNPKVDVSLGPRDAARFDVRETPAPQEANEIECGVDRMRAPEVWSSLGVTGDGAVVAVIDSGVCWTHSDIVDQVWVNPGEDVDGDRVVMDPDDENGVDDDGNGFVDDLVGWNFEFGTNTPGDDNSHGSHCAGTVAGDGTAGTQSGMAPDAKIMILRVGLTFSDEVDVWNAMQYAAANGADAISMSLGWPHGQNPDRATWRANCDATIEAGTAMVIAAGNEGQGSEPDNIRTPGDVPRVISVAATDCADAAASFTSRGPVTWQDVDPYFDHPYPPGLVKPDVAAPGVNTRSHNVCSGYSTKSGTSMATPHVAGAVALMVSANPGLGHDEIKQVLEDTAVDRGAAGKDNTFGSGAVDAYEAVNAVFGLSLEAVEVVDADPAHANGDGGIDVGETVTLRLTLRNQWDDRTATDVEGWLTTPTAGVVPAHDWGTWPDVPPLATAVSLDPSFSVRVEEGCNRPIEFTLHLRYSGRTSRARFAVRVGTAFDRDLLVDDFEADQGWSAAGSSATGVFVREDPNGIRDAARQYVQPEDDATPGGVACWVTGNDGRNPGDDDVDAGTSDLLSPVLDATDFEAITLRYVRWFHAAPTTLPESDFFRVQWSRDGATWAAVESVANSQPQWLEREAALPAAAFGPGLRVRFQAEDSPTWPVDSVVEAAIDDVEIRGRRVECDAFAPPPASAPHGVGDTLVVERVGDDVRLSWQAPPADAFHDPATAFRVYRSGAPSSGFAVEGLAIEPWRVAPEEALAPETVYWLVAAENGGGLSEDAPF